MFEKLIGRNIVECREAGTGFVMTFENGEEVKVAVSLEGDFGTGCGWQEFCILRVNGECVGDRVKT
ncbi:MAG: hypothetical protein Q8R26_02880 [bacterium]|nr:hypothetical protein [bacterium]